MACETERNPLGVFKCQLCALTAPYSYQGQQPPDSQSVVLLEESYVMKDPFTPDKGRFLIVGSRCSMCGRLVCVGPVGMQFILLEEILPPLCPGQRGCFPSGNSARLGEKESPLHEACQPAQFSTMSAVGYQGHSSTHPGLVTMRASMAQVRDGAKMEPLCRPSLWAVGAMSGAQGGWGLPAATPGSGAGRDGAHRQTPDACAQGPQPPTLTAPTLAAGETLTWARRVAPVLSG